VNDLLTVLLTPPPLGAPRAEKPAADPPQTYRRLLPRESDDRGDAWSVGEAATATTDLARGMASAKGRALRRARREERRNSGVGGFGSGFGSRFGSGFGSGVRGSGPLSRQRKGSGGAGTWRGGGAGAEFEPRAEATAEATAQLRRDVRTRRGDRSAAVEESHPTPEAALGQLLRPAAADPERPTAWSSAETAVPNAAPPLDAAPPEGSKAAKVTRSRRAHDELRRRQVAQPLRAVAPRWPTEMTPADKAQFKACAPAMKLLIKLGYANDTDW
jgi:hypothetical protein